MTCYLGEIFYYWNWRDGPLLTCICYTVVTPHNKGFSDRVWQFYNDVPHLDEVRGLPLVDTSRSKGGLPRCLGKDFWETRMNLDRSR